MKFKKINYSVRLRVTVPAIVALLIIIVTFGIGFRGYAYQMVSRSNTVAFEIFLDGHEKVVNVAENNSIAAFTVMTKDKKFLNILSSLQDESELILTEIFDSFSYLYGISALALYNQEGELIEIDGYDKNVFSSSSHIVKRAIHMKNIADDLQLSKDGSLSYISAGPIILNGQLQAFAAVAVPVDYNKMLHKHNEDAYLVLAMDKTKIDENALSQNHFLNYNSKNWGLDSKMAFANTDSAFDDQMNLVQFASREVYDRALLKGVNEKKFICNHLPVYNAFGDELIEYQLFVDVTFAYNEYSRYLKIYLALVTFLMLLLAAFYWWYLGRVEYALGKANKKLSEQIEKLKIAQLELNENERSLRQEMEQRIEFENQLETQLKELDSARQAAWSMMEDFYEQRQKTDLINKRLKQTMEHSKLMAKEAENANLAKSQFLANMSHEIRTPMNAIIGFADLLKKSDLNESQEDYINTIVSSGQHLLRIINDILDISKVEAGELKLESYPLDLVSIAGEVMKLMETTVDKEKVQLKFSYAENLPALLMGDATRLRQIIQNVISNSIKFTHEGHVSLTLNQDGFEIRDGFKMSRVEIHVEDTGIGIDEDKLARIFEPFSQADNSTTRRYGGTGLGLSIVKHFVETMGGSIKVSSVLGKGTEFSMIIPLALAE